MKISEPFYALNAKNRYFPKSTGNSCKIGANHGIM
nr:MAG TPA: hypothetical protein [Caudoviricetes sp.]